MLSNLFIPSALRGFFHPFYRKSNIRVSLEEEARRLLTAVAKLHEHGYYQKVYFTCPMNDEMAEDIKKAYQKGERLTHAKKHYHRANREAQLMMMVEKLLESEFPKLRSFAIAPLSICAKRGGTGEMTEYKTRSQLQTIQDALDQGHAVFCITDEPSWQAQKPLSVTAEKLSVKNGNVAFPPALNQLTQETLMGFQADYPIPTKVLSFLRADSNLQDAIKDVDPTKTVTAEPKTQALLEAIDTWIAALYDAHLLKTWPLKLDNLFEAGISDIALLNAVTVKQKQDLIYKRINDIALKEEKSRFSAPVKMRFVCSEAFETSAKQLARKYAAKIKAYLDAHPVSKEKLEKTYSKDIASEINRVRLAKVLRKSLKKVYLAKIAPEDRFDVQDFFDIIDSAESYAVELSGTHSKLQSILNDLAWEAKMLKKREAQVEPDVFIEQPLKSFALVDEYGITVPPLASQGFMASFRGTDDVGKVTLLKGFIANKIGSIYDGKTHFLSYRFDHSKEQTAARLKAIRTTDLHEYWMILEAEFATQEEASSTTRGTINEALEVLKNEFPPLLIDRIRHFTFSHACKLLKYINRQERSLAYKFHSGYGREHIDIAGELAHEMLKAKTLEELHSVMLKASDYMRDLEAASEHKRSPLVSILRTVEKDFKNDFRHRPIAESKPMNEIWQETFNGAYLYKKFEANLIKPEDRLQKRCHDLGKEKPQNENHAIYLAVRMCALLNAMCTSKYAQKVGKSVRERMGAGALEKSQHRYPAMYYAQYLLARMDEVKTHRDGIKQKIEAALTPFLTDENHTLTELNDTIRGWIKNIKDARSTEVSRFFVSSQLQTFLEKFNKNLEDTYPAVAKHARISLRIK